MPHSNSFPLFQIKRFEEFPKSGDPQIEAYAALGNSFPGIATILSDIPKELNVKDRRYLTNPMVRLAYWINSLPASMAAHDSEPGGLFSHSVRIALAAGKLAQSQWDRYKHIPEASEKDKFVLLAFWAGLLHDVGKVRDHLVKLPEIKGKKYQWDWYHPLTEWVHAKGGNGQNDYTLEWRHGRETRGPRSHEPYGTFFLDKVILPKVLHEFLSVGQANSLVLGFCGSCRAEGPLPLYDLVKQVDIHDVRSGPAVAQVKVKQPAPSTYGLGESDRFHDFKMGIRTLRDDTKIRWNHLNASLLTSGTHTVISMEESKGAKGLFRLVYEHLAEQIRSLGVGGMAESFFRTGMPFTLVDEFKRLILEYNRSFAIECHPVAGMASHIVHVAVVKDGKRDVQMQVVIFKNEELWGDCDISKFGRFDKGIKFFCHDGKSPSIDPEDIGFKAFPEEHPRRGIAQQVLGQAQQLIPLDGLISLESPEITIVKLWNQIHRMVPLPSDGPMAERFKQIEQAIAGGVSPSQIGAILEACHYRLRSGMHSVSLEPVPERPKVSSRPVQATVATNALPSLGHADLLARGTEFISGLFQNSMTPTLEMSGRWILRDGQGRWLIPWPQICESVFDRGVIASLQQVAPALAESLGGTYQRIQTKPPGGVGDPRIFRGLVLPARSEERLKIGVGVAVGSVHLISANENWTVIIES